MSFYDAIRVGASGAADFEIERSLRFNRPDSTYLTKSLGSTSNRRTFTYSFWVKRTVQNSEQCLIYNGHPSSTPYGEIRFEYQGSNIHELNWYSYDGSHQFQFRTNRKFRDPSAWYHIVLALDTTQATQSNRAKIYVNGIQETSFKTETYPSQNTDTGYNVSGNTHSIGGFRNTSNSFDGYVAEFNFIDGQQLTPSSFAETNSDTGQWVPIDTSGLTFGTNGFRLKFADNSGTTATTLGKDSSGNGNNFTPNNFSVSAGAGNDSVEDTPTNNFCIINPLAGRGTVFLTPTNGNLDFSLPSGSGHLANASFLIPTSGKWYAEYVFTTVGSGVVNVGNNQKSEGSSAADQLNGISMLSGEIRVNDSSTQTSLTAFGNNDIIGVKVDRDAGTVAFTINGSAVGNAENISSMNAPTDLIFRAYRNASGGSTPVGSINFGQRPFSYLPTGYKSLCSQNLSDPTILLPNKNFDTVLYTGNGATSARAITGFNFAPDWVWLKNRDTTYHHQLHDTVRGVSGSAGVLYSNNTNAEDNT